MLDLPKHFALRVAHFEHECARIERDQRGVDAVVFLGDSLVEYYAGQRLGAVTLLPPVTHGVLRLSLTWAIALVAFSVVVRRVTPDGHWPRYHTSRSR